MKTKTLIQKSIECSVSLRYICPNNRCGLDHWLFLREAKTKNFKVVCECGTIFKPKLIKKLNIVYKKIKQNNDKSILKKDSINDKIQDKIVDRAISILIQLGYSKQESIDYINKVYDPTVFKDHISLVKATITKFGELS